MRIINLTGKFTTCEQLEVGVFAPEDEDVDKIKELLVFQKYPTENDIEKRAKALVDIANKYEVLYAMIDGPSFFMSSLEKALKNDNIQPLYSFGKMITEEVEYPDGVINNTRYKHEAFIMV